MPDPTPEQWARAFDFAQEKCPVRDGLEWHGRLTVDDLARLIADAEARGEGRGLSGYCKLSSIDHMPEMPKAVNVGPEWISVEERLPELLREDPSFMRELGRYTWQSHEVLVCVHDDQNPGDSVVVTGHAASSTRDGEITWVTNICKAGHPLISTITHWAELPQPPEVGGG